MDNLFFGPENTNKLQSMMIAYCNKKHGTSLTDEILTDILKKSMYGVIMKYKENSKMNNIMVQIDEGTLSREKAIKFINHLNERTFSIYGKYIDSNINKWKNQTNTGHEAQQVFMLPPQNSHHLNHDDNKTLAEKYDDMNRERDGMSIPHPPPQQKRQIEQIVQRQDNIEQHMNSEEMHSEQMHSEQMENHTLPTQVPYAEHQPLQQHEVSQHQSQIYVQAPNDEEIKRRLDSVMSNRSYETQLHNQNIQSDTIEHIDYPLEMGTREKTEHPPPIIMQNVMHPVPESSDYNPNIIHPAEQIDIQQSNLPMFDTQPYNTYQPQPHKKYTLVNSKYRDLSTYTLPSTLKLNLNNTNDTITYNSEFQNDVIVYNETIIKNNINKKIFKNIGKLKHIIIPNLTNWICGTIPQSFTGPLINEDSDDQFDKKQFSEIYDDTTGIKTQLSSESSLILKILKNKSNINIPLVVKKYTETYIHVEPNSNENISLNNEYFQICTTDNQPLQIDHDKLYIKKIESGGLMSQYSDMVINGKQPVIQSTRLCLQRYHTEYSKLLANTLIVPGDTIYIYQTLPEKDQIILFTDNVIFNDIKTDENTAEIILSVENKSEEITEPLDIYQFVTEGDYLWFRFLSTTKGKMVEEYVKVISIEDNIIKTTKPQYLCSKDSENIQKMGFGKVCASGVQTLNCKKINKEKGVNVVDIINDGLICNGNESIPFNEYFTVDELSKYAVNGIEVDNNSDGLIYIDIDFPFELLDSDFVNNYIENDMFLIQKKMQIDFVFETNL